MMANLIKKVFGSKNDRELRRMGKIVKKINAFDEPLRELSDDQLSAKTAEFRERLQAGESLDQLLPEAFAVVREAADRTLGMRHFDVQMIGGITLHEGCIAEMRTGEGKTLMSTLPAYLNALPGDGVHIITVNDYLAKRDADWMRPIYELLGLTVGVVYSGQMAQEKQLNYSADITYGTNNEFGFDYLRDNMALRQEDRVQRKLSFAVVDEVDSILIDEARTPLIISGAASDSSEVYKRMNRIVQLLKPQQHSDKVRNDKIQLPKVRLQRGDDEPELVNVGAAQAEANEAGKDLVMMEEGKQPLCQILDTGDFVVDEKSRTVELTEQGHEKIEGLLINEGLLGEDESLYQSTNLNLLHHVHAGLKAHHLFRRDVDYIVEGSDVVLIDEHTGRKMLGRRLSEGLHQAIEAREGVQIQQESQTLASTTFQNYFRLYDKLSGMTGTADTEAYEFHQIYGLTVVVIPTNRAIAREDLNDLVYLSQGEKYQAVIEDIRHCMEKNAPVLVGTASIETSELLSGLLKKAKVPHQVLNAKFHEKEAQIIAQAGRPGAVTIATNMAGRGTDIVLGGNWEAELRDMGEPSEQQVAAAREEWEQRHATVLEAGGLHIIGTERHESRRIDNQLRGRAGRQGDPGLSRFYLSLEDPLMRLFASDRVKNMMRALGMKDGEAIEHRMVSNAIEKAQRKVEGRNFDIRKHLLEFDDVANDQRQVVYQQRNDLLESDDISDVIDSVREDVVNDVISAHIPPESLEEQWDIAGLEEALKTEFLLDAPVQEWLDSDDRLNEEGIRERVNSQLSELYKAKCDDVGPDMRAIEKQIMLQVLDQFWKEHLASMDHLRQGINLRAYAQKNPKQEYKRESFELFEGLLHNVKLETTRFLCKVQIAQPDEAEQLEQRRLEQQQKQQMEFQHAQASAMAAEPEEQQQQQPQQAPPGVGRNDPCPCGSGKKFKQCHGKLEGAAQPFVREMPKVGRNDPCPCGSGKKFKQCHGKLG
ncbi:preprotein translocase subunit SecA [Porticoccus sp. W117]|uniref:preprotein translocase subunit SecA n=1 Tax=Porticoccus sp. W117 TaxID=3054777 RepID=UPI0025988E03|nr:preprotein translocase subunit SecA [Porticoccus sp. W117]MDM3871762.1 preprotein translocase subunit SecA [Porticoccus sp. W117]